MEKIIKLIEEKLVPPLSKFANLKYLQILQKTFVSIMSLLLVGSLFLLVAQLPIEAWKNLLGENLISLLTRAAGVGTQAIAIYVAISTAYYAIQYYNDKETDKKNKLDPMPPVLLTVSAFLLIFKVDVIENASYFNVGIMGAKAIFTAIVVSLVTIELYRFIIKKNLVIKMPNGVPPMIAQSFMALVPTAAVVLFWWIIRWILNIDIQAIVLTMFNPLIKVSDSIFGVILLPFLNRALWFIGVHGGAVVGAVSDPMLRAMDAANLTAAQAGQALPHIASYTFFDQYVWVGLAPFSLALMTAKSKHLKAIGWLALPAALFNIGEPLNFGVPIVLNPIFLIPSIFAFVLIAILSYGGVVLGMLPIPYIGIPWTVPAPIKAFLGTNADFRALVWILICWAIMFMFIYPFVKALDRQTLKDEKLEEVK